MIHIHQNGCVTVSGDQEDVVNPAAVAVYCSRSTGTYIPNRPVDKVAVGVGGLGRDA